jgi:hypothetical protein
MDHECNIERMLQRWKKEGSLLIFRSVIAVKHTND